MERLRKEQRTDVFVSEVEKFNFVDTMFYEKKFQSTAGQLLSNELSN